MGILLFGDLRSHVFFVVGGGGGFARGSQGFWGGGSKILGWFLGLVLGVLRGFSRVLGAKVLGFFFGLGSKQQTCSLWFLRTFYDTVISVFRVVRDSGVF